MDFLGLIIPDWIIGLLIIFYMFIIWVILQLLRRKMPIRIWKGEHGQALAEFKGKEDDLKLYWKEGFSGQDHEAMKASKPRLKPFWGITNKIYVVRHDFNMTIPLLSSFPKISYYDLCGNCQTKIKKLFEDKMKKLKDKGKLESSKETVDTIIHPNLLCPTCQNKYYYIDSKNVKDMLCETCKPKIPEFISIDFINDDTLKGSSTEAVDKNANEEFCKTATRSLASRRKGDILIYAIAFTSLGMMLMFTILLLMRAINI